MNATTSRRAFLASSSALTVGFCFLPALDGHAQPASSASAPAMPPALPGSLATNRRLDGWLRINADGTVTMFTGKVEFGQGILTALTQIVGDELDVKLSRIAILSGETGSTPNEGVTSGSLSIQDSGTALRYAAAETRALLLQAASLKLGQPVDALRVDDGMVSVGSSRISYWELSNAAMLQREASASIAPKLPSRHTLVGTSVPRLDIPAKVTGGVAYVQDMRLPGMLFGRVMRPNMPRATLLSVDEATVRSMPGVVAVVRDGSFLAVAARREEQAIAAAAALRASARWSAGTALPPSGPALFSHLQAQRTVDTVVSEKGGGAVASASSSSSTVTASASATTSADSKRFAQRYTRPYMAHASIGPSCAVAQWNDGGKLQVWSHTQGVYPLRADLAKALGVPTAAITVTHKQGSGCYGHNGADDVALDAALLARATGGVPVKLQWMREDEFAAEPLGSAMVVELSASTDASGRIVDWQHDVWSHTHSTRPNDPEGCNLLASWALAKPQHPGPARNIAQPSGASDRNAVPLYVFARQRVVNHLLVDTPIRTSALRTLGAYANVFALESFIDELAGAHGADPVEFRLRHLQDARARAVIERAATLAGWQGTVARDTMGAPRPVAAGVLRGRGIGFARYKNLAVYCAVVAEVSVDTKSGAVHVERALAVADAGQIINPDGLRNQIEGGMIQSTSWTLLEQVPHDTAHLLARNWGDYAILRFPRVPAVRVDLIDRPNERSLGVGEGAQGPMAAAIGNAFAQATGRRLRDLPLLPDPVLRVLA